MAGPTIARAEVDVDFDGSGMDRQARRIAQQAGRAFSGEFSDEVNSHLDSSLSPAGRRIARVMGDAGELSGRSFTDRLADSVQARLTGFDDNLADAVVSGDWEEASRRFNTVEEASKGLRIRLRELQKQGQLTSEQFDVVVDSFDRWRISAEKSADVDRRRVSTLKEVGSATRSSNREEERSFSIVGRLSGARNDFLNIVGKSARLLERMPNLFEGVGGGIQSFTQNIMRATEGLSGFQRVAAVMRTGLSGIGQSLKGLVGKGGLVGLGVTVGLLAVALLGLGNLLTSFAAGLSALTGIVTALASSLTAALGGALLSLGPILGATVAGIAGVTIAILQNQDAFAKASKPLTAWVNEVGKVASANLLPSITRSAETLASVLSDRVTPLLAKSAKAVGDWSESFADALNSGPMRRNLQVFQTTWPGILRNLGDLFTSAFTGLSGILAAISPSVEKFTGLIADAVEQFSKWANSASGQNSVKEFFDGAWESATKLWDILSNVATAIGNVFSQGKDTGDSFLDSLVRITDQFATWTDSDEGREAISRWFEDAKSLASTLGDFIGAIAERFDEWDTERNRQDFEDILDAVAGIVSGVMQVVTGLNAAADWLADMDAKVGEFGDSILGVFGAIGSWFSGQGAEISGLWDGLTDGLSTAWAAVQGWWTGTFLPWLQGLPGQVGGFFVGLWDGLGSGLSTAWASVQTWWTGTFVPWLQGLPGQVGQMIQAVAEWFISLPFRILDALVNLPFQIANFFTMAFNTLQPIVTTAINNIVSWMAALPGRIISGIGSLAAQLGAWATNAWNTAYTAVVNTANRIVAWVRGLPARIASGVSRLPGLLATWATNAWNRALSAMTSVVNRILSFVRALPGRVVSAVTRLGGLLATWATNAWNRAYTSISNVAARIVSFVRGIPGRILGVLQSLGGSLASWARGAFQRAYDGMSERGQAMVRWIAGLPGRLISAIGNVGSLLYSVGTNIVDGLYRGLQDAWGRVTGWAGRAASGLSSAVRKVLGISSPSKVFMEIGKNTAEGFIIGFSKQSEKGKAAYRKVTQSTVRTMTDGLAKGSKEAGKEVAGILAKVQDMQVAALKSNQRALAQSITSARKGLTGVKETSTVKDLREYYAGVQATVKTAGANLRATIKRNGTALTDTLKQYEASTTALTAARKKLDELKKASSQLKQSVSQGLQGQLNLQDLVSTEGGEKPTFAGVASYIASMKSKAQTFSTKMKKLVAAGLPPALIQQLAGLGIEGAIEVANALLSGTPKQLKALKADFNAFTSATNTVGTTVANAMYKTGIDAQKGLIDGLVADTGDLKKAAKKLTDRLTKYVKNNLGIKSPSRVFRSVGEQVMNGMALGIARGTGGVLAAAGRATTALTNAGSANSLIAPRFGTGANVYTAAGAAAGRSVIVQSGAIQVNSQVQDPRLVASQVLDRLVTRVG